MQVELFTLCQNAANAQGALNIQRAFSQLNLPAIPGFIPPFKVAIRVRYDLDDEGPHELFVRAIDGDAKEVAISGKTTVRPQFQGTEIYAWIVLVVDFPSLRVPQPSEYRFELLDNKRSLQAVALVVTGPL